MDILIQGDFFEGDADIPRTRKSLLFVLEALVQMNRMFLRFNPGIPGIYQSGVIYKDDPFNADPSLSVPMEPFLSSRNRKLESWCLIPEILKRGGSDCKNLVAWRCAEQQERGIACRPYLKWKKFRRGWTGGNFTMYHVIVEYPPYDRGGRREDPSKILGMGHGGNV